MSNMGMRLGCMWLAAGGLLHIPWIARDADERVERKCDRHRYAVVLRGSDLLCRTLKPEPLEPSSQVANTSREAIQRFLDTLPASLTDEAQAFRVERAKKAKA